MAKTELERNQYEWVYRTKKHDHGTILAAIARRRLPALWIEFIGRVLLRLARTS